jgi:hypothetical protein
MLYVEKNLMNWRVLPLVKINTRMLIGTNNIKKFNDALNTIINCTVHYSIILHNSN